MQTLTRLIWLALFSVLFPTGSSQAISLYSTLTETLYMDCVRHVSGSGPAYRVDMKLMSTSSSSSSSSSSGQVSQVLIITKLVEMGHDALCQMGVDPLYDTQGSTIGLFIPQFDIVDNSGNLAGVDTAFLQGNTTSGFELIELQELNQAQIQVEQRPRLTIENMTERVTHGSGTSTAGVCLDVTPRITPDDRILMDLRIVITDGPPTPQSVILNSTVSFDDTTMPVIFGGATISSFGERTAVPVLGEIPLLGYLFKSSASSKRALSIFVTPTIVDCPDS